MMRKNTFYLYKIFDDTRYIVRHDIKVTHYLIIINLNNGSKFWQE